MTEGLIASLVAALAAANGAAGTVGAKNAHDTMEKGSSKEVELPKYPGEGIAKAIKNGVQTKMKENEMNTLLVDLVAGGLSSKDAQEIAKTGNISNEMINRLDDKGIEALSNYLGIPSEELRKKLTKMSDEDIDNATGNNEDPNHKKSPKEAAKNAAKAEGLKKARDKFKKWDEAEQLFQKNEAEKMNQIKSARDRWGRTEYVPGKDAKAASQKITNDPVRRNITEYIDVKDPKFSGLSPEEQAELGTKVMNQARENGTLNEWEYNHVTPHSNIPAR